MNNKITTSEETDQHWMREALLLATQAENLGEVPVGCVITNADGKVAEGFNERETAHDPTAHAELIALKRASQKLKRWRLSDCTLYVTLEPCFMCAGAIVNARVGRVVFAATDPKAGAGGSLANVLQDARLNHRCEVQTGLLDTEAAEQLKSFFRKKRQ